MVGILRHDFILPSLEHLFAPDVDHPAFLIDMMTLALVLKLSEIPKHLLILFFNLDKLIQVSISDL